MRPNSATPLVALLALSLGLAACQSVPTPGPPIEGFYASRTKADLSAWIGRAPERCLANGPGKELCGWVIGKRYESWRTLAASVETGRQVNVVCEVPVPEDSDARKACAVHPRESQPFDPTGVPAPSNTDVAAPPPADHQSTARRALDSARTMRALSDLVGDVPNSCDEISATERRCSWRLSNRTRGFELVAAAVGTRKRVRLTCGLPADGSDRTLGSCRAAEDLQGSAPEGA
jgi:hypothetical protein